MFAKVASTKDLSPGEMIGVESGGKMILLANVGGKYYAMGNKCTHRGCKLNEGTLNGDQLRCRCHGSTFDVKTGGLVKGPAKEPEPAYQVKVEGDQIQVNV